MSQIIFFSKIRGCSIGLNKPLVHGIQHLSMLLFNLAFITLSLTPHYSFIEVAQLCVICWYMWMILCLMGMILDLCNLLFSSLVLNFHWKIWVLLTIFYKWKLYQLVHVYSCHSTNISVICCPKPTWYILKIGWWYRLC